MGGRPHSDHDDAQRGGFFSIWRRVLAGKVAKHPVQTLVEVIWVGTVEFYGVVLAFQKISLGDIIPRRCKRAGLESV